MPGRNYFLVTALPGLEDLGSAPPLSLPGLLEHVDDAPAPHALIEALVLADDLLQRQAFLAGEIEQIAPAVLTGGQATDEEPLPAFLATPENEGPLRAVGDVVWEQYYRHVADVARRRGSKFLAAWGAHEVALRNALAKARAEALGLEPADYLVAADLADRDADFDTLIHDWSSARDPLEGLKVLDRARWQWLGDHDGWFTFADDELVAYAAKLMLLCRWHRLTQAPAADASRPL